MTTPDHERLRDIGQAMYGEQWQSQLARALGISDRTMRRMAAGQAHIKASIWADITELSTKRAAKLVRAIPIPPQEQKNSSKA